MRAWSEGTSEIGLAGPSWTRDQDRLVADSPVTCRKATRVMTEREEPVTVTMTVEILKDWADLTHVDFHELRLVPKNVELWGRFRPGQSVPLCRW